MKPGEISGLAELNRLLAALPETMVNNVLRGAAKAGAKVIAEEAKLLCPVEHGDTRDSIGVGSSRVLSGGVVRVRIRTKGKGAFKAPWLEWGTDPHFITIEEGQLPRGETRRGTLTMSVGAVNRAAKKGSLLIDGKFTDAVHHPGSRPHPFMRPALDNKQAEAVAAAAAYIKKRLSKAGLNAPAEPEGDE